MVLGRLVVDRVLVGLLREGLLVLVGLFRESRGLLVALAVPLVRVAGVPVRGFLVEFRVVPARLGGRLDRLVLDPLVLLTRALRGGGALSWSVVAFRTGRVRRRRQDARGRVLEVVAEPPAVAEGEVRDGLLLALGRRPRLRHPLVQQRRGGRQHVLTDRGELEPLGAHVVHQLGHRRDTVAAEVVADRRRPDPPTVGVPARRYGRPPVRPEGIGGGVPGVQDHGGVVEVGEEDLAVRRVHGRPVDHRAAVLPGAVEDTGDGEAPVPGRVAGPVGLLR